MGPQDRLFPRVTDEWFIQEYFLRRNVTLTSCALSPRRFPSVTDDEDFQDHLLSKTTMQN